MRADRRHFAFGFLIAAPFMLSAQQAETFGGAATPKEAYERLTRGTLKEDVEMVASVLAPEDRGTLLTPLFLLALASAEGLLEGEAGNPAHSKGLHLLLQSVSEAAKANPIEPSTVRALDEGERTVALIAHGVTHLSYEETIVLARAVGETLRPVRHLTKHQVWRLIYRSVPRGRFVLSEQKDDEATAVTGGKTVRFVRRDARWLVTGLDATALSAIAIPRGSVRIGGGDPAH